jgi:endonuclease G
MKIKSITLILTILLCISITSSAQEFLPTSTTGQIVKHTYYTLSYSEKDEQPEWVYYELTPALIRGKQARTDDYRPDTLVSTISAQLEDYRGSGYDRGHLCPAGDMKLNLTSMSETFYLSNMSPQKKEFNDGIWNDLENKIRQWALASDKIYVVTGGVLTSNKGKIGLDGVTIPKYFYKIIYDPKGQGKMIAFLIPNEKSTKPLQTYVVSVDSVESLTGIDFFPELPDSIESHLERKMDLTGWSFNK